MGGVGWGWDGGGWAGCGMVGPKMVIGHGPSGAEKVKILAEGVTFSFRGVRTRLKKF